jgi:hypothetical protein
MPDNSNKGGSGCKYIVIGCGILFLCIICCAVTVVGGSFALFGAAASSIQSSVKQNICALDGNDINTFYATKTTANFRSITSEEEFNSFIDQFKSVFKECNQTLGNINALTLLSQGWKVDTKADNGYTTLNTSLTLNGNKIDVTLKNEKANGELKLDYIGINQ